MARSLKSCPTTVCVALDSVIRNFSKFSEIKARYVVQEFLPSSKSGSTHTAFHIVAGRFGTRRRKTKFLRHLLPKLSPSQRQFGLRLRCLFYAASKKAAQRSAAQRNSFLDGWTQKQTFSAATPTRPDSFGPVSPWGAMILALLLNIQRALNRVR